MQRRYLVQWGAALAAPAFMARGQGFANQPVRLLLAYPAGGPTDASMRTLADNAGKVLGQPVIVENRPGASGTLPAQALQSAAADGHTLAQIPLTVFRLPYTRKMNWNPLTDLSYLLNLTGYVFGVVVQAESALNGWGDFVAWARDHPGRLSYGTSGTLSSPHLTMERIAQQLGIELLHVPYKGSADLMQSLLGGQIMAVADSTGFAPHVEAGKLRVLNIWNAERLARFPDAPTLKELGLDLVQNSPFGIATVRGTPAPVLRRLHDAFKQAMSQANYRAILARYDMLPMYMDSASYRQFAHDTVAQEKALVQRLGLAGPPA